MTHFKVEIVYFNNKKTLFLTQLEWDWQTGNYVTHWYGWRRFKLNSASHLNNWIKRYKEDYIIDDVENAISFFK